MRELLVGFLPATSRIFESAVGKGRPDISHLEPAQLLDVTGRCNVLMGQREYIGANQLTRFVHRVKPRRVV